MDNEVYIADESEFDGHGSRIITEIDGQEIAIFNIDGEYYAIVNYCVHQGGPLCEGKFKSLLTVDQESWEWGVSDEKYIECPWHTWQFDITTGENVADPSYRVPTYEIENRDSKIYIIK